MRPAKEQLSEDELSEYKKATDPEKFAGEQAHDTSYESINPRLMALGMATYPAKRDVRKAALSVGIYGKSLDELNELYDYAKKHHKDISELRQSALSREAIKAQMLHVLLAQAKGHLCAPSQLGNAAKSLAAVSPEGQASYSEIYLNLTLPGEKKK